jgi:hypothetical protein
MRLPPLTIIIIHHLAARPEPKVQRNRGIKQGRRLLLGVNSCSKSLLHSRSASALSQPEQPAAGVVGQLPGVDAGLRADGILVFITQELLSASLSSRFVLLGEASLSSIAQLGTSREVLHAGGNFSNLNNTRG